MEASLKRPSERLGESRPAHRLLGFFAPGFAGIEHWIYGRKWLRCRREVSRA